MQKKQLEIEINKDIDFAVFIGIYPELKILVILPFFAISIHKRQVKGWFRFINRVTPQHHE